MKKIFIISVILISNLILSINYSHAQNSGNLYKNEVRMGIWQLFKGGLHLSYERYFNSNSIVITNEITLIDNSKKSITGYFTQLQYRFYLLQGDGIPFLNLTNEGFYAAPAIKYRYKRIIEDGYDDIINTVGLNLVMGLKYSIIERISLDINFGGTIVKSVIQTDRINNDYQNTMFSEGYTGVAPVGNITIGIRF
ncbi:MAG: hypothetical protein GXO79_09355 [Chlorobi bacterium]|nr:hypothetical protein [Chlorobiota bacterium]